MTPKYITKITRKELEAMMKAGRLHAGPGIKLETDGDGIIVSIDAEALKPMLWCYIQNATTSANTVSLTGLKDVPMTPA